MFEAKLAMRLQSSEPKCANCKSWDQSLSLQTFGRCKRAPSGVNVSFASGLNPGSAAVALTTDLSVCSKWESKD